MVQSRPTPPDRLPTNMRIITIAEVFPKEQGVQVPFWTPQPRGSCNEKMRPRGLTFGRPRGLWGIKTPLLEGTQKIYMLQDPGQKQSF